MSFCSNIPSGIKVSCSDSIKPMSLDEKRQLLDREKWINNVIRILNMPRCEAENLWVRIQVANHNESLNQHRTMTKHNSGSSFS